MGDEAVALQCLCSRDRQGLPLLHYGSIRNTQKAPYEDLPRENRAHHNPFSGFELHFSSVTASLGGPSSRLPPLYLADSPGHAAPALALSSPQFQPDEQPAGVCSLRGPLHVCLQVGARNITL